MQVEDRTHFLNRLDASEDLIFGVRPTLSLGSSIVPDTHCAFLPYLLCWCIGDRCLAYMILVLIFGLSVVNVVQRQNPCCVSYGLGSGETQPSSQPRITVRSSSLLTSPALETTWFISPPFATHRARTNVKQLCTTIAWPTAIVEAAVVRSSCCGRGDTPTAGGTVAPRAVSQISLYAAPPVSLHTQHGWTWYVSHCVCRPKAVVEAAVGRNPCCGCGDMRKVIAEVCLLPVGRYRVLCW